MIRRRRTRALWTGVGLSLLTACGSALSDDEILARTGESVTAASTSGLIASSPETGDATVVAPGGGSGTSGDGATPTTSSLTLGAAEPTGPAIEEASGCQDRERGPIVIGNVGDYSGAVGASVADQPNGLRIWAADINARGGLCGREVRVLSADAAGDPARSASLVRQQVEQQGAIAFVANTAIGSGSGTYPYIIEHGIPSIGDALSAESARTAPTILPTVAYLGDVGLGFLRAASRIGGSTSFGMLYCVEDRFCSDIHTRFLSKAGEAGVDWRWDASASVLQVDYTAECQAAQRAGVQLFAPIMDAASVLRVVRSCNRQGFHPVYVLIGSGISSTTTQESGLEDAVLIHSTFPFAGASSPAIDEFQRVRELYFAGRPPTGSLAGGYASAKLFELVATRAALAAGTISTESLLVAMQTVQGETLGGLTVPLTWAPNGSSGLPCVFPTRADGGGGFVAPLGSDPVC